MNECLTTPQHEKQIGYWVSEKGKCMKWLIYIKDFLLTLQTVQLYCAVRFTDVGRK